MSKTEVLKQPNLLTTALYSLNRNQKRIFYLVIQGIKNNEFRKVKSGYEHVIPYEKYEKTFECENGARDVKKALKNFTDNHLASNSICFEVPEYSTEEEVGDCTFFIVNGASNNPKNGCSSVVISEDVHDILIDTKVKYTLFLLANVSKLRNIYAMRIYELISQWRRTRNTLTLERKWVTERFCLPPSYNSASNFKYNFLDRLITEINENTDITLTVEEIKKGKRKNAVSHIKLIWEEKEGVSPLEQLTEKYVPQTLEQAVITYSVLLNKDYLPSKKELENLKAFMGDLLIQGFEINQEFMMIYNQAVVSAID